jgi:hypothetical protein
MGRSPQTRSQNRVGAVLSRAVVLAALAWASSIGCDPELRIYTAAAPGISLARYSTFTFAEYKGEKPPGGFSLTSRSNLVHDRIECMVGEVLREHGYEPAEGGDLVVSILVGVREARVNPPPLLPRPVPSKSTGWSMENETTDIVEGALVIDVLDATTSEFLWHGTASAQIDPEKVDVARIRRAVSEVLARFPRREGKPQRADERR